MMRHNKLWMALIAGIIMALLSFAPASAHSIAGGNGRIYGQLLDGSRKNAPLAGQSVTLQMARGNSAQDLRTTTTDAQGMYNFTNLATDQTINYAVYINYQGAQYVSNIVALNSKPVQQVNLTVYESTSDTSKIAIVQATLLVNAPDARLGTFTVSEFFSFQNLNTRTFVGSLDASKGRPHALFFSLPKGARNIVLGKGFDGYRSLQADSGFATNAAIVPGDNEFAFSFEVPYTTTNYDFAYTAMYPTVALSFMVPPDIHASSGTLLSQGIVNVDQHSYQVFKGSGLLSNQQVHLQLSDLPAPASSSSSQAPAGTINPWLIVILLVMLAVLGLTWFLYRSYQQPATRKGSAPAKSRQQGKGASEAEQKDAQATEGRRQALLRELLALDKAFEAGKVKKGSYEQQRARLKARLRSLMSEQETASR
ncbi:MAG TPA: carboxypeptidase-like regulatory domain-containing protein [Ktedonobacteraceae bacterium]|nr:carboxypeptidase-like regulatory domain-containing protein [Ktedonobacteraceae bacterium]